MCFKDFPLSSRDSQQPLLNDVRSLKYTQHFSQLSKDRNQRGLAFLTQVWNHEGCTRQSRHPSFWMSL